MIKIIGATLIIIAMARIGFFVAGRFGKRVDSLMSLREGIALLESEITFSNTAPAEAFLAVSDMSRGEVKSLFCDVYSFIKEKQISVEKAFDEAIEKYSYKLCLEESDTSVILDFASHFGRGDSECEIKNIRAALTKLDVCINDAAKSADKNKKMYQSGGILCGILTAVILI